MITQAKAPIIRRQKMFDFIATKEKAKRTAYKYGLRFKGDFELKKVCFNDKSLSNGIFWTYDNDQLATLISVYGFLKIIDKNKIQGTTNVILGEKYPMCGNCFRVVKREQGLTLIPVSAYN